MADIEILMKSSNAYLKDNQYELAAKIILLSNKMDGSGSTKCAFNCMSGKDRTGILDGVVRTFAVMIHQDGKVPSHDDLMNNPAVREKFTSILKPMLLEMGGLDVVEVNTGVRGYKVGKEAMLGLSSEDFLAVCGLSKTTAS